MKNTWVVLPLLVSGILPGQQKETKNGIGMEFHYLSGFVPRWVQRLPYDKQREAWKANGRKSRGIPKGPITEVQRAVRRINGKTAGSRPKSGTGSGFTRAKPNVGAATAGEISPMRIFTIPA